MSSHKFFRRSDGIVGVGFVILYGGVNQFSISWPDRPCERFTEEMAKMEGIEVDDPTIMDSVVGEASLPADPSVETTSTVLPTLGESLPQTITSVPEPPNPVIETVQVNSIPVNEPMESQVSTGADALSDV